MKHQGHFLAVMHATPQSDEIVALAHEAIERGDLATLIVALTDADRKHIADFAAAVNLGMGEAEATYIDHTTRLFRSLVGDAATIDIVDSASIHPRSVLETAERTGATIVAVPAMVASRRPWRSAISRSKVAVLVAPGRAA
jgi:hypothetical protein